MLLVFRPRLFLKHLSAVWRVLVTLQRSRCVTLPLRSQLTADFGGFLKVGAMLQVTARDHQLSLVGLNYSQSWVGGHWHG